MFDEIHSSLNSVKLVLVLSVLIFIMTFNTIIINGLPLIITGAVIYAYHLGVQTGLWGSQKRQENSFIKDGLYKYIRHPVYLSILIIHLGIVLSINSLAFLLYTGILVFPYLYLRASVEDNILIKKLPDYAKSMKTTKMFIPKVL